MVHVEMLVQTQYDPFDLLGFIVSRVWRQYWHGYAIGAFIGLLVVLWVRRKLP